MVGNNGGWSGRKASTMVVIGQFVYSILYVQLDETVLYV